MGASLGWPSPVLYEIRHTGRPINLTDTDTAVMVSMYHIGNVVMPLPSGLLIDYKGRKTGLLLMTVAPITSWILIYFVKHSAMLHVARLLAGFWSGVVLTAVPLYIGEIAEPKMRGALGSLGHIFINIGLLLVYTSGSLMSYWNLAIMCGAISFVFVPILVMIPESPHWLIQKGASEKAAKNLLWLRGGNKASDVSEEIESLVAAVNWQAGRPKELKTLWKSRGNRKAVIIVEVLGICQRMAGISAVIAFTAITLPDQNIGMLTPDGCVAIIFGVGMLSMIGVIYYVDRFGRVPLLIISCTGCCISMLTACVWYALHNNTTDFRLPWIPFASLLSFNIFFNLGLGPIPGVIQGEIIPPNYKAFVSGWTAIILAFASLITNAIYIYVAQKHG
ncbi:unnamed protein product, partial [Nesidiocoris tenuis]